MGLPKQCPTHLHYSHLPCAWPGCSNGIAEDSLIAVYEHFPPSDSDRETRFDRIAWPPYRGQVYYSWETSGWPSPWINASNIASYEHSRRYPRSKIHDVVYQYTSAAALQSMIESNELWLTDYAYLNDSSELLHGRAKLEQVLESLSASAEYSHSKEVFGPWLEGLRNGPSPRICVASFSMDCDSLSQWRAYGGLALGFDWRRSFGYMPETLLDVVTYNDDEQVDRIGLFAHHHHFAFLNETPVVRERLADHFRSLNQLYRVIAFFKHHSFIDEREVRLVYVEGPEIHESLGQKRAVKRYRTIGNQLIPYVTTGDLALTSDYFKHERSHLPLKEVVVGPHPRAERMRQGIRDFLVENGYPEVEVRLSNVPYQPH